VPSYSRVLTTEGDEEARHFPSQICTLLLASQLVLLAARPAFTPCSSALMAPGFEADPDKLALAVRMTRNHLSYLLFITLVTLHSGTLNAHGRFARRGFCAGVAQRRDRRKFLSIAFLFPDAGRRRVGACCFGRRAVRPCRDGGAPPEVDGNARLAALSADIRQSSRALSRIIGSAGQPIAIFADTSSPRCCPRRSVFHLLRRAPLPVADRRHRHRGGDRFAAGDEPFAWPAATWAAPRSRRTHDGDHLALSALSSSRFC